MSKILEKVVAKVFQSAYDQTILLNKLNKSSRWHDSLCHGKEAIAILTLLDFPAAFDVVDHERDSFSEVGHREGLDLIERQQFVEINESMSKCKQVPCGVPQGSVIGPLFFTIFNLTHFS